MKFETFRDNCKFMKYGADEYLSHKFHPTCRKPDRIPQGNSWGTCDKAHCPFYGMEMAQGKIYMGGKEVAEFESGRAVWAQE